MALRISCVDNSAVGLLGVQQACEDALFHWNGGFHSLDGVKPSLESDEVDILISEVRVGKHDVLDYWQEQSHRRSATKLIVYTYNDNPTHVARASSCHAWDYIIKRQSIERLIQACRSASQATRLQDSIVLIAKEYFRRVPDYDGVVAESLTPRERQTLAHLAFGLSNREISSSMEISLETVKEHVQNVLRKLKTKDRTAAAVWAIRNGLPKMNIGPHGVIANSEGQS